MPAQPISSAWMWQGTTRVLERTEWTNLEVVVRQYSRLVFKVAYGVVRNSHDAEDVVQEVFLRVHKAGVKDVRDIPAWLASIAFRLAIDHVRKPQAAAIDQLEVPTADPDAEQLAIHRQRVNHVQRLIAALPEDLRYPLVLSALEELDSRQIAEILGTSESAVRGRIFRARQILKEKLSTVMEKKS